MILHHVRSWEPLDSQLGYPSLRGLPPLSGLNSSPIFNLFEPNCLEDRIGSNNCNKLFPRVVKIGKKWSKTQIMVKVTQYFAFWPFLYKFDPPQKMVWWYQLKLLGLLNILVETNWKSVKNWGRYEILNIRYRLPEIVVKIPYISNFTGFGIFCSKSHIGLNFSPIFNSFQPECSEDQVGSTDTHRSYSK